MARLPSLTGLSRPRRLPPREEARPRPPATVPDPGEVCPHPRGTTVGVAACLRGQPRPLLGGGETGPAWRAFPFSTAENLFVDAMSVTTRRWSKEEEEAGGMEEEMSNGGSGPLLIYSQKEANRRPPRSQVMIVFLCMQQGLVKSNGCRGSVGKRRRPRLVNRHALIKAAGGWARGTPHLPFGFASKPSPSAPWARGLLSAFWERGSPDLPACGQIGRAHV